jgi:hypothetical protein
MRRVKPFPLGLGLEKVAPPAKPIRLAETGFPFAGSRGAEGWGLAGLKGGVAQRDSPILLYA